jgi:NAD(P)H-dependent FMN reductase
MRILAVSGSLRAASSNTSLLHAAAALAPAGVAVELWGGLAEVPPFDPDRDVDPAPPAVAELRRRLTEADAVLVSSPEYAHGVPGSLKNALDWLVGSGELMGKPVGLLNASAASTFAHAQLTETLTVMMGRVVPEASVVVPLWGRRLTPDEMAADPEVGPVVREAVAALARAAAEATP